MFFKAGIDLFQADHVVKIRKIIERAGEGEPVRYVVHLTGQNNSVDVAGDDLPPFEQWLQKELLQTAAQVKPEMKPQDEAKKVA